MAETLGSLVDKLTIVKLKQYHSDDAARLASLAAQEGQLQAEVDDFVTAAVAGQVPPERLTFVANKVYKAEGNAVAAAVGSLGSLVAQLADANSKVWHVQEKVYDFARIPAEDKDGVISRLAVHNLERTQCIDAIDALFRDLIQQRQGRPG